MAGFPVHNGYIFTKFSHGRGAAVRELSRASFIKALTLFMRAPPFLPKSLPKAPSPNTITLRIRFQHMNLGETHGVYSSNSFILRANERLNYLPLKSMNNNFTSQVIFLSYVLEARDLFCFVFKSQTKF